MKRKFLHALMLATAVAGLSACSDDDDGPSNYFKYDTTVKSIKTASIDSIGGSKDTNGNKLYAIGLFFGDAVPPGVISEFDLILYSSTQVLADGTYTITDLSQVGPKSNQIIDQAIGLDIEMDEDGNTKGGTEYDLTSGSAVIKKSGDSYTVDFTGKAVVRAADESTAKDVKMHFSGKFTDITR